MCHRGVLLERRWKRSSTPVLAPSSRSAWFGKTAGYHGAGNEFGVTGEALRIDACTVLVGSGSRMPAARYGARARSGRSGPWCSGCRSFEPGTPRRSGARPGACSGPGARLGPQGSLHVAYSGAADARGRVFGAGRLFRPLTSVRGCNRRCARRSSRRCETPSPATQRLVH